MMTLLMKGVSWKPATLTYTATKRKNDKEKKKH